MSLERRKPMPPRKDWMNRSSLRSSTPPAEGKVQPTRRKTGKHVGRTKAQRLMRKRCDGKCEPRIPGVGCLYWVSDFHHRILKGQGGEWAVANGLGVCRMCHLALTNTSGHRAEYEHYGWIIPSQRDPEDRRGPAEIEVFMWHDDRQDWWLLLPDGTAELAPFPKGRPEHPDDLDLPGESQDLDGVA
jgi:hypothetical protein